MSMTWACEVRPVADWKFEDRCEWMRSPAAELPCTAGSRRRPPGARRCARPFRDDLDDNAVQIRLTWLPVLALLAWNFMESPGVQLVSWNGPVPMGMRLCGLLE